MQERDILPNYLSTNVRMRDVQRIVKDLFVDTIRLKMKLLNIFSENLAANYAIKVFCTTRYSRKSNEEVEVVFQTATIETHQLRGEKIKTYIFGSQNAKSIFLVHGWEGQARDFYKMINPLVEAGYKVITIDGPAHGYSSGVRTNLIEFSLTLKELVKIYGISYEAFIGHSFGGASIVKFLSDNPQVKVKHTITISSPNKIINIFKNYAKFMHMSDSLLQKLVSNFKETSGEDINDLEVTKMYKKINAKKLLIHDFGDGAISYNIAEEILDSDNEISHLKTNSLGHMHILRSELVHREILDFLE